MALSTSQEAQLQRLLDREAIEELLHHYAGCIDRRDWAGLQGTYTEDGIMDHGAMAVGRDRVPELSEMILKGVAGSHHLVGSPHIEVDGDTAATHSHYFATHIGEGGRVIRHGGGWYDCTLRRTEAGWRFTRVKATSGWREGEPLQL